MIRTRDVAAAAVLVLAACSGVEVPRERFYRLELPATHAPDPERGGVLRVQDLQLHTALDSDSLQRLDGVRLEPQAAARWVAPLDRLVTDALVLGLSRARVCELVKSGIDPGGETWTLRGRIVDFVDAAAAEGREARVGLELWLEGRDRLLFHDEFTATEPLAAPGEAAVVAALSRCVHRIVADLVGRMRDQELFAMARAEAAAAAAAAAAPVR